MTHASAGPELQSHMEQLEKLLQEVEAIGDPAARSRTSNIIQTLLEFHGAGISSIVRRLAEAGDVGKSVLKELAADELTSSLLLLYGLHPQDLESRVQAALEKARPVLGSHSGDVRLVEIGEDGTVVLQMQGNCHGCPSSAATMKSTIEKAIYEVAPDVTAVHLLSEEVPPETAALSGFVPVELLTAGNKRILQPQGAH